MLYDSHIFASVSASSALCWCNAKRKKKWNQHVFFCLLLQDLTSQGPPNPPSALVRIATPTPRHPGSTLEIKWVCCFHVVAPYNYPMMSQVFMSSELPHVGDHVVWTEHCDVDSVSVHGIHWIVVMIGCCFESGKLQGANEKKGFACWLWTWVQLMKTVEGKNSYT